MDDAPSVRTFFPSRVGYRVFFAAVFLPFPCHNALWVRLVKAFSPQPLVEDRDHAGMNFFFSSSLRLCYFSSTAGRVSQTVASSNAPFPSPTAISLPNHPQLSPPQYYDPEQRFLMVPNTLFDLTVVYSPPISGSVPPTVFHLSIGQVPSFIVLPPVARQLLDTSLCSRQSALAPPPFFFPTALLRKGFLMRMGLDHRSVAFTITVVDLLEHSVIIDRFNGYTVLWVVPPRCVSPVSPLFPDCPSHLLLCHRAASSDAGSSPYLAPP